MKRFIYGNMLSNLYGSIDYDKQMAAPACSSCGSTLTEAEPSPGFMCCVPDFRADKEDIGEERRKLLEQSEQLRGFDPLLLLLIRNIYGDITTM